ncbi:MAG TPA: hypothetical protein VJ990_05225 [Clostridia bacterium]|nr:hypothetical protein [Clostridia bacterium]
MLDLLFITGFIVLLLATIAAWINTKILISEMEIIKSHLNIPENESRIVDN